MLSVCRNEQWPPSTCLRLQQGVGEGGREVEEKGGVASTEPAGVVMAAGAGTMKSRMNTTTTLKNMALWPAPRPW